MGLGAQELAAVIASQQLLCLVLIKLPHSGFCSPSAQGQDRSHSPVDSFALRTPLYVAFRPKSNQAYGTVVAMCSAEVTQRAM